MDQLTRVKICKQGGFIARCGGNEREGRMENEIDDALSMRGDAVEELIVRELKDCELAFVGGDDEMGRGEGDSGLIDGGGNEEVMGEIGDRIEGFGRLEEEGLHAG